jgi:hypothetical protein
MHPTATRLVMARAAVSATVTTERVRSARDDSFRRPIADSKGLSMGHTHHGRVARDGVAGSGRKLDRRAIGDEDSVYVAGVCRRQYSRGHASDSDGPSRRESQRQRLSSVLGLIS